MSTPIAADSMHSPVRIQLLGPVEASHDGQAVRLGGSKQRIALTRLALAEGRPVQAETLIDDLWGRDPPDGARHALQSHISRLRQSTRLAIEAVSGGYVMPTEPIEVDTTQFARLCAAGQELLESGQAQRAVRVLSDALDLWRGPVFADLGDVVSLRPYAIRLEEMWRAASADRIDAALTCGQEESVIGDLRAILDDDPLRERAWRQLMIALYRQDRESEALGAYQTARNVFIEELGTEPGEDLGDVHLAILQRSLPSATPEPHIRQPSLPIVLPGRNDEIQALSAAWTAAQDAIQLVTISGEPGIGKTRLAMEFTTALQSAQVPVYTGRCERERSAPYLPFTEIMRAYHARSRALDLRDDFGQQTHELWRVLPELDAVVGDDTQTGVVAGLASHHTFDAVADWLETVSAHEPIAIVLDDVHWADHQTLLLLEHLLLSPRRIRMLILVTVRDRQGSHESFKPLLRQSDRVTHLPLGRLDPAEISTVLSHDPSVADVSGALTQPDIEMIQSASGGNPLFVVELARQYATTRTRPKSLTVPSGIRDVIAERLAPLSDSARDVLQCAALIGTQFEAALVRDVTSMGSASVDEAISAAVHNGLIDYARPGRYAFSHDVVRVALHKSVPPLRAADLHLRIADAIERRYDATLERYYSELAQHLAGTNHPDAWIRASRYFMLAGDDSLARNAPTVAADFYGEAMRLAAGNEALSIDALIALGTAQFHSADFTYRGTLLEAAQRATAIDDAVRLAAAAVANTRGWWSSTSDIDHERVAIIETALRSSHPADVRARLLSSWAQENIRDPQRRDEAIRRSDEALLLAEQDCAEPIIAQILSDRHSVLYASFTDVAECVRINERLLDIAHRHGDPGLRLSASVGLAQSTMTLGEFGVADRYLDQAAQLAETHHQPARLWLIRSWQAMRVAMRGQLTEAEEHIHAALDLGIETQQPDALTWFTGQMFTIRLMQGRLPEILDEVIEQVNTYAQGIPSWHAAKALALASAGETDDAGRILESFVVASFEQLPHDMLWLHGMAYLCATCELLQRDDLAPDLYKTLASYSGLLAHNGTIDAGPVDLHLAAMARLTGLAEEAQHHTYDAAALCRRIDAPVWLGRL